MGFAQNKKKHKKELDSGERFAFGANWLGFLTLLDDQRISQAENSLKSMLEIESMEGKSFLDIGCGSGIFSLAAKRLGAKVFSFDYDPKSVECAVGLRDKYYPNDYEWIIQTGSVLDKEYLDSLGKFDIVYSWGVLHHTGDLWGSMDNVSFTVKPNGKLFISIYNYQQFASTYWLYVKWLYNKFHFLRPFFIFVHALYPVLPSIVLRFIQNREYRRGMSVWYDLLDWLGGYPFEVSTPERVFEFFKIRGYTLVKLKTVGGAMGCNEFVFSNLMQFNE